MKNISIFILLILISGCVAYKIPNDSLAIHRNDVILHDTVKLVGTHTQKGTEEWLSKALIQQKLSKKVVTSSSNEDSRYKIDLESSTTGKCFSEPLLTVLTLGVIPYIGCSEIGYKILVTDNNRELFSKNINKKVKIVFGIASWFFMMSSSWVGEQGLKEYKTSLIVNELSKHTEKLK